MAKNTAPNVSGELMKVRDLLPSARNSRKHSDQQIEGIVTSMKEFGFTIPVLVDEDNGIIAGHGRVMAASRIYDKSGTIKTLAGTDLPAGFVPVLRAQGWSDAQKRAYIIADNKLAANAEWDDALLASELMALRQDASIDLGAIGFTDEEIDGLIEAVAKEAETPEEFPEVDEQIDTEHQCPKCGYRWSGNGGA